jgi:hypothetical protein
MHSGLSRWRFIAAVLAFAGVALAQANQQKRTLVVNGQSGDATIVQINGRSYIDLETLARIANGSLSFQGTRIVLTIPPPSADAAAMVPADRQTADSGLSNDFMRAAIQDLATIKEWYGTLAYAIQRGVPGDGSRVVIYRDKAAQGLKLATVAASTDSDQNALQLLTTHFNNVQKWSNMLVESRKSLGTANYSMSPNALNDDPLYQTITRCSQFLGTMLAGGKFEDDGSSCH